MARRRPQTFQSWALGLIGVLITCVVMYYARVAAIEYMAERQIERTQAAMAKIQEQAARQQQQLRTAPLPTHQADQYDAQVMRAAAESQRQHEEAWERFYQAPRGCDNWKTDQQMVECQNHKLRAKREFEQKWAAGELSADS
jgi:IS5 family transposase